jgi:hypothetical protein
VAHSELCGEAGGPSSADDYLSALASVKGKSKKAVFNPAKYRHFELHIVKLPSATRVTRVKVTVKRGEVSARSWPNSNPGRLAVVVPAQGLVGFARVTPHGSQSQTVHVSFPVTEAVAFAQLVERVERPVTVLVDETVERGAHARATPSRGTLPLGTQASRDRGSG